MPGVHDQKASRSFYYNSNGSNSTDFQQPNRPGQNGHKNGMEETPSYWVEHLATFAVGREYGLESPSDGLRKLKLMEKSSAIWAQPMVMRLRRNAIVVEDENSEVVESFPFELISHPTAHISSDRVDVYNNILLFIVAEDRNRPRTQANGQFNAAEMHIFQCSRVSANEVLDDIKSFLQGRYQHVKSGRRDTGYSSRQPDSYSMASPLGGDVNSYTRTESTEYHQQSGRTNGENSAYPHVKSDRTQLNRSDSADSTEYFERDVNTLNGSFDDIEKFVARIQQSALAQREIERLKLLGAKQQQQRRGGPPPIDPLLAIKAQLPNEMEFVEILQKFKLCFNLLAKLKSHINDPNAPELLHFLFTPLTVILDSSRWGLGEVNLGPRVHSPLLTRAAVDLMTNGLTTKEAEVWRSLGDSWTIPIEDWDHRRLEPAVAAESPVLVEKSRKIPEALQNGNVSSMEFELEKLAIENDRLRLQLAQERQEDRERRLAEEERRLEEDRRRLLDEREKILMEKEKKYAYERPAQPSPIVVAAAPREVFIPVAYGNGQQQQMVDTPRAFLSDLQSRGAHIAQVTYDRVGQNHKELTVVKGEFLEVLNDNKNWWDCRNGSGRTGFVPKTILFDFSGGQNGFASTSNSSGPPSNSWPSGADSVGQTSPPYAVQREAKPTKKRESFELAPNVPAPPLAPLAPLRQSDSSASLSQQQLNGVKLRPTQRQTDAETDSNDGQNGPKIKVTQREAPDDPLLNELKLATMKRSEASKVAPDLKRSTSGGVAASRNVSEFSGEAEISDWLETKGFSIRTLKVLEGQTGATLFSLTKPQLQQFCGKDEGSRLYSQLLIQKNQSGFKTKSAAELNAILQVRKSKADRSGNLPVEKLFANGDSTPSPTTPTPGDVAL